MHKWDYMLKVDQPQLPNTKFLAKLATLKWRDASGEYWVSVNTSGDLYIQASDFPNGIHTLCCMIKSKHNRYAKQYR